MRFKRLLLPFLIIGYRLSQLINRPLLTPMSVSLYITYRCNSRCRTCNIWKQHITEEMQLEEIRKTLKSIGKVPLWFTITGGEPFLNDDLVNVVELICRYNHPLFINIATNGLATDTIAAKIEPLIILCQKYKVALTINLSIDELGDRYDDVRGTHGGFKKVLETYQLLAAKSQNGTRFNLGTNTTLSIFNIDRVQKIYSYIKQELNPNSILFEMASIRNVFFLADENISPAREKFKKALAFLKEKELNHHSSTASLIQFFRRKYYSYAQNLIDQKKPMKCYAGTASAEIISNGNVVTCCTRAAVLGNLREQNYQFKKIWKSQHAKEIRNNMANTKCACDLSNIFYTNAIINLKLLT